MIIIAPYARGIRESEREQHLKGTPHPKNYPYWREVIDGLDDPVIQIGVEGEDKLTEDFRKNLPLVELAELVKKCVTWISVDSFFPHFCWDLGKPGIALFGKSDPNIFGHPENINLFVDRKRFRENQFWMWEQIKFDETDFVKPNVVLKTLKEKFNVNIRKT